MQAPGTLLGLPVGVAQSVMATVKSPSVARGGVFVLNPQSDDADVIYLLQVASPVLDAIVKQLPLLFHWL